MNFSLCLFLQAREVTTVALLESPGSHSAIGESIACKLSIHFIGNTVNYVKY